MFSFELLQLHNHGRGQTLPGRVSPQIIAQEAQRSSHLSARDRPVEEQFSARGRLHAAPASAPKLASGIPHQVSRGSSTQRGMRRDAPRGELLQESRAGNHQDLLHRLAFLREKRRRRSLQRVQRDEKPEETLAQVNFTAALRAYSTGYFL